MNSPMDVVGEFSRVSKASPPSSARSIDSVSLFNSEIKGGSSAFFPCWSSRMITPSLSVQTDGWRKSSKRAALAKLAKMIGVGPVKWRYVAAMHPIRFAMFGDLYLFMKGDAAHGFQLVTALQRHEFLELHEKWRRPAHRAIYVIHPTARRVRQRAT
ncbi:hypothetical protein D3C79_801740 [compost metagenome]